MRETLGLILQVAILINNMNHGNSTYVIISNLKGNNGNKSVIPTIKDFTSHLKASRYRTRVIEKRQLAEEISDDEYYWQDENYFDSTNITAFDEELINKYGKPKSWAWALVFLHCIVFVIGLLGNILVCIAVYRNYSMQTVTNYLIVNLAVADALVILFCLPFSVVWDVTSTWWFGTVMCKIVLYLQSVSVTVSVLTLTFISIDRWYAICFPLKFKSTTGKAKTAICIIWIIALVCEIPEMIFLIAIPYSKKYTYFTQCAPTWHPKTDMVFMIVKMVLFYWLPLILISVAYTQIIRVLWGSVRVARQTLNDQSESCHLDQSVKFEMNTNKSTECQLKSRRKVAKMLVVVVAMFAICFFPVHFLSILRLAIKMSNSDFNRAMSTIFHWLCYANSAVNPIIYNFMSGKFRQEFRSGSFKCCQVNRSNFTRTSVYSYRYSVNNNRQSVRSKTEMVQL